MSTDTISPSLEERHPKSFSGSSVPGPGKVWTTHLRAIPLLERQSGTNPYIRRFINFIQYNGESQLITSPEFWKGNILTDAYWEGRKSDNYRAQNGSGVFKGYTQMLLMVDHLSEDPTAPFKMWNVPLYIQHRLNLTDKAKPIRSYEPMDYDELEEIRQTHSDLWHPITGKDFEFYTLHPGPKAYPGQRSYSFKWGSERPLVPGLSMDSIKESAKILEEYVLSRTPSNYDAYIPKPWDDDTTFAVETFIRLKEYEFDVPKGTYLKNPKFL